MFLNFLGFFNWQLILNSNTLTNGSSRFRFSCGKLGLELIKMNVLDAHSFADT